MSKQVNSSRDNPGFKVVGESVKRSDALLKTMGLAEYTDDIDFKGLAYGVILRSPYSRAKVELLDDSEAKAVPGFIGLITPDCVTDRLYNSSGNPPSSLIIPDESILSWEPKYMGDRILAVVADSEEACHLAIRRLKLIYHQLDPIITVKDALKADAPQVQTAVTDDNVMKHLIFEEGDLEKGFSEAEFLFEGSFQTQAVHHLYLEPTSVVANWAPDGKITVYSPSQTLYQERRILSELLSVPESDIRIIKPEVGGGFGARQQLHNQHVAILLSRLAGRPVKLLNTREEDLCSSSTRHETESTIKIGVKKDGTITAVSMKNYLNGGPYITHTPTVAAAAGKKFQYKTQSYRYDGISVYTNSLTAGAMRGYGNLQLVFGREILMDRIARELNLDPVEMRLAHHVGEGDHFPGADYDIWSCGIEECARKAQAIRAKVDADSPPGNDDTWSTSWGVAFACHSSGPSNRDGLSSAVVMGNDDGSIVLSIGSADIGQGAETVMAQIAAEALGIKLEDIHVNAADTGSTPYDTGTFASSVTFVCGNAVKRACLDMRNELRAGLAHYYQVEEDLIEDSDGLFKVPDPDKPYLSLKEAINRIAFGLKGMVVIGQGSYKALSSPPPFAVCMARAQYNKLTTQVNITDIIEVVDVGTAINPDQVKAQIHGGVSMSYGYTMMEDLEYNRRVQKVHTTDLLHFKAPLMNDMPNIYADIAENVSDPSGPFGAKSVGELAQVPVAPAIANAISRAAGIEINTMPISRILAVPTFDRRLR
ncbi:MAG: molybdopterin-dependent oxidoreductase [Clostridiaceae bacterium]|nr:molybdopterin-dependent oxidoreductase [Clostridiaceae bacterium]